MTIIPGGSAKLCSPEQECTPHLATRGLGSLAAHLHFGAKTSAERRYRPPASHSSGVDSLARPFPEVIFVGHVAAFEGCWRRLSPQHHQNFERLEGVHRTRLPGPHKSATREGWRFLAHHLLVLVLIGGVVWVGAEF